MQMDPRAARLASAALLLLLAFGQTGCLAVLAAGGVGTGIVYAAADLETEMGHSPKALIDAADAAIKEIDGTVLDSSSTAFKGSLKAKMADGKKISIKAQRMNDEVSRISIRVGSFGNDGLSAMIFDRIQRRLDRELQPQAVAKREEKKFKPGYDHRIAAIVGINKYENWPPLEGARGDARRMSDALKKRGFEVIELYDEEASRERILQVLGEELPERTGPDSLALIFFAGHGQTETLSSGEKRGYLIPADGDASRVFSTAISMAQLRDLSQRIPAKHVYYVMDSCYSGLGFTRGISVSAGPDDGYVDKLTSRRAVQMITAGREGETVVERGGRGLFTTYFLRALEGEADANGDGMVTATEIGVYLSPAVTAAADSRQTPMFGTLEGSGEVVFGLSSRSGSR